MIQVLIILQSNYNIIHQGAFWHQVSITPEVSFKYKTQKDTIGEWHALSLRNKLSALW